MCCSIALRGLSKHITLQVYWSLVVKIHNSSNNKGKNFEIMLKFALTNAVSSIVGYLFLLTCYLFLTRGNNNLISLSADLTRLFGVNNTSRITLKYLPAQNVVTKISVY